ncbi:MAG: metal ABC transporter solute-binding protein, Zn/Mn family [Steroidobacteraceae bacterium]
MLPLVLALALLALLPRPAHAASRPLRIVAAENFYGDIAAQLAGPGAQVVSVLNNAAADPHLFEPGISTARAVADADLVIYNGLSYDVWMEKLLAGTRAPHRRIVVAASMLAQRPPDGAKTDRDAPHRAARFRNPHLWYDPAVIRGVARAIAAQLTEADPAGRARYDARLRRFLESMRSVDTEIARLRAHFSGTVVASTEPLAQYLTEAIGLTMSNERFQLSVMNGTEPSARDTADFERALRERRVRVLIYNGQVASSAVRRLLDIARESGIPVVGMTETEPPGVDYQQWMLDELRALGAALQRVVPRSSAAENALRSRP